MTPYIPIAIGVALVGAIGVASAQYRTDYDRTGIVEPYNPPFQQRWDDAIGDIQLMEAQIMMPRPVRSILIPREVLELRVYAADEYTPIDELARPPIVRSIRKASSSDVCSRHGLRKVTTGNTWRCRK